MAGLEVEVGADIKDFQRKIKEVENDIQELANEKAIQIRLGLDTKEISAQIKDAKKYLNDLKQTVKDTGASFQKDLSPKVANGGNALMQFSRIAQDAPFGIMGIGNNITATAESFGYLVKETGSAGGALKAVASSIMGTGGILLAVSLVTTGLTIMAQKGLTVSDVFAKMTGTFDEARRSMQEINAETAKNAQAQISSVGAYVATAKNINLSMQERLIAVKKLQDEYPAYFGNLTKEQILNGQVASTVREVTKALIAKAKAASYTDRIVKLAEQEEKINAGINNEILRLSKLFNLSNKEAFQFGLLINQAIKGQITLGEVIDKNGSRESRLNSERAYDALTINRVIGNLAAELRNNQAEQERLTEKINQSVAASIKLEYQAEKVKKVFDTPQVSPVDNFLKPVENLVSLSGMLTKVAKDVEGYEGVISTSLKRIPSYFDTSGQAALAKLQDFNKKMNDIIQGGISQSLSGLAESIGDAFSTGGNVISAVGKSLLSTLGGVLIELGKMAISTGVGILAIQTALKSLNPYVAIAAGAALVTLGSAVKGSVKGLGSSGSGAAFSTGNGNISGSNSATTYSTGASYSSPVSSYSIGSSGSFATGTVVFEIAGTSLIGVLNNTLDKNKGLGGSLTI